MLTLALLRLAQELMHFHATTSPIALLNLYIENSQVYELLYMLVYYLCLYWMTRGAIKSGNYVIINNMWRYWLHLFIATQKSNYTQLTIRFMWCLRSLNPVIVDLLNHNCVFLFSGDVNSGIPYDSVNELVNSATTLSIIIIHHINCLLQVNWYVKGMNGMHPSEARISWTTKSLNFSLPIMQSIKQLANSKESSTKQYQQDTKHNGRILFDHIRAKFGVWHEEVDIKCTYDPTSYKTK